MSLISLNPNERVVLRLHRHPIILFFSSLPFLALLVLPIALYVIGSYLQALPTLETSIVALVVLLFSLYFFYIILFLFYNYFDFILDVWVVTDSRIINIEQKALFVREASELDIDRIQDVTAEVRGMLPTIFGYGDIYIQTAGEKERFVFRTVQHPYETVKIISRTIEEHAGPPQPDGL